MLDDKDRIFTNLDGMHDRTLAGAKKRGHWDGTAGLIEKGRDWIIEEMKKRNIGTSVHFIPLHVHPYYREQYGYEPNDFPNAFEQYSREISLPIFSKMSRDDVYDVSNAVLDIIQLHRAVPSPA